VLQSDSDVIGDSGTQTVHKEGRGEEWMEEENKGRKRVGVGVGGTK
jgi:hypothetical protein